MKKTTREFWLPKRVKRLSYALLLAWMVSFALFPLVDDGGQSSFSSGDFPAFYTAAFIVNAGKVDQLYELSYQESIQQKFFPELVDGFYVFAYPPYVAWLLSPLASLDPYVAKFLFTVFQVCALLGVAKLLGSFSIARSLSVMERFVFLVAFSPVFIGVCGAQNTALSMFLFLGSLVPLRSGSKKGEVLGGLFVGVWLFKPHFGLVFFGFLLILRKWRAVASASLVAAFWYLIGVYSFGESWLGGWLGAVSQFGELDYLANAPQMISLSGALYTIPQLFSLEVDPHILASVGTFIGGTLFALILLGLWFKSWAQQTPLPPVVVWCFVGVLTPLLSPHALFYDMGIQLVSLAVLLSFERDSEINLWLALAILSWIFVLTREATPVPYLFLFAVTIAAWGIMKGKQVAY